MSSTIEVVTRERAAYAARCGVLREERHLRLVLADAEDQVRRDVCRACVDAYGSLQQRQEEEQRRQSLANREHYVVQLHRNPNSPMPTLDTVDEGGVARFNPIASSHALTSSTPAPANALSDLVLWEAENRQDLQTWASEERRAMALGMLHIFSHQRACERKLRERVCETVLSGATVLEWQSYPSYDD